MELTAQEIQQEIARLQAESDQFAANATRQLGVYAGAIQTWQVLLARTQEQKGAKPKRGLLARLLDLARRGVSLVSSPTGAERG